MYFASLLASAILVGLAAWIWYFKDHPEHKKIFYIVWIVGTIVLSIIVYAVVLDGSGQSSSWDNLSEEEKDWYRDNFGDGQYDKYQDAIDKYKGY